VLAQADDGLTCFFMPRFAPDASVNAGAARGGGAGSACASASLNRVSPHHTELFAASRLATAHAGMHGAIDLSEPEHTRPARTGAALTARVVA
jgi:hypothetical protein